MAGEEDGDDVIVSLPADTSNILVSKVEPEKKAAPAGDEDPIADLKSQFSAMTQRATAAENAARQATQANAEITQRLHRVEGEVVTSQLDTVLSGIAAADAEASNAEQALALALEAGDHAAAARANRAIAAAEGRKARLEEAKDDLEDAVKRRPTPDQRRAQEPPQRRQSADPIDAFTQGMSSRSAAWIKSHPECVTDPKLNARMLAAHNLALADDVKVDSDEYFERIEAGIKPAQQQKQEPKRDGTRPSSAAASAAGAGGGLNGGGVEVKLSKREAASATDGTLVWNYDDPSGKNLFKKGDPIGLAEMARRKHEGMKAGLYDRMQYEA